MTSRALDSSATLTEVADSSELLYTGVSRGGCIQQLSRMRYPWLSYSLEFKFNRKLLLKNLEIHFEAFHGDFLLEIGIISFRDLRKTSPSKIVRARP